MISHELSKIEYPNEIFFPISMLSPIEHKLLYLIGKEHYQGKGIIIDAGAFGGASAFCLAAGVNRNSKIDTQKFGNIIHSYDNFLSNKLINGYLNNVLCAFFSSEGNALHNPVKYEFQSNFKDFFDYQTAKYSFYIKTHVGDFLNIGTLESDIEICFVDICKSQDLTKKVFKCLLPKILPNGLFVQQDFYVMLQQPQLILHHAAIEDLLKVEADRIGCTRVYRIIDIISESEIERRIGRNLYQPDLIESLVRYKTGDLFDTVFINMAMALAWIECGEFAKVKNLLKEMPPQDAPLGHMTGYVHKKYSHVKAKFPDV